MSTTKKLLMAAGAGGADPTEFVDVTGYTGSGSSRSIVNDLDLSSDGGLVIIGNEPNGQFQFYDTRRGAQKYLTTASNSDGGTYSGSVTSFNTDGFSLGSWTTVNQSGVSYMAYTIKESSEFFDIVNYTGNGASRRTVSHNLGTAPEMMIVKSYDSANGDWAVYHKDMVASPATAFMSLNSASVPDVTSSRWNNEQPQASYFVVGASGDVNGNYALYVAYLFSTVDGVSKVGSYTGNGTSQTIDCGFSDGARFVVVKRTDASGNWCVFDTARGIVEGSQSVLTFNTGTYAAQDAIDYDDTGFVINNTDQALNASGGDYIFYAFA